MLLYIITLINLLKSKKELEDKYEATKSQLELIENAEKSVLELEKEGFFKYNQEYKRFEMEKQIQFAPNQHMIIDPGDREYLRKIGFSILNFTNKLKLNSENKDKIKYLIIIEGQASDDSGPHLRDFNYELSYRRAKALYDLWVLDNYINFDKNLCEIHISGNGTGGVGRYKNEKLNQRFLLQIIPKIAEGKNMLEKREEKYTPPPPPTAPTKTATQSKTPVKKDTDPEEELNKILEFKKPLLSDSEDELIVVLKITVRARNEAGRYFKKNGKANTVSLIRDLTEKVIMKEIKSITEYGNKARKLMEEKANLVLDLGRDDDEILRDFDHFSAYVISVVCNDIKNMGKRVPDECNKLGK